MRASEDPIRHNHHIAIVAATRNRVASLKAILPRLLRLPEAPPAPIVDDGSTVDTCETIRREYPGVALIGLGQNLECAARNEGGRPVATPYVAFSDDDSRWAAGAIGRASELFVASPGRAWLAARVLVGHEARPDLVREAMAAIPLTSNRRLPDPGVLGFVACGSNLRRSAYHDVGGFEPRFGIGGKEELCAGDLAVAGTWPTPPRSSPNIIRLRSAIVTVGAGSRSATLWTAWLRRPAASLWHRTLQSTQPGLCDPESRTPLIEAVRGLPWVLRNRRQIPPHVEVALRAIGQQAQGTTGGT
jgi:hypothetical protein